MGSGDWEGRGGGEREGVEEERRGSGRSDEAGKRGRWRGEAKERDGREGEKSEVGEMTEGTEQGVGGKRRGE